ncbi:MAG: hypothetical protein QXQ37_06935 [Nitrososphaerota archaeon]
MNLFKRGPDLPIIQPTIQTVEKLDNTYTLFFHNLFIVEHGDILLSALQDKYPSVAMYACKLPKKVIVHDWIKDPADKLVFLSPNDEFFSKIMPMAESIDYRRNDTFWRPIWYRLKSKGLPEPMRLFEEIYVLGLTNYEKCMTPTIDNNKIVFVNYSVHSEEAYKNAVNKEIAKTQWGIAKQLEDYYEDILKESQKTSENE